MLAFQEFDRTRRFLESYQGKNFTELIIKPKVGEFLNDKENRAMFSRLPDLPKKRQR